MKSHTLRGCVDWNHTTYWQLYSKSVSHPAWVCGLKRYRRIRWIHRRSHTLRGCVDWNNQFVYGSLVTTMSHPAWVCGLKHNLNPYNSLSLSHPAWVCGLKPINRRTFISRHCHTLRGCVDWNCHYYMETGNATESHPAWVCGLKQWRGEYVYRQP